MVLVHTTTVALVGNPNTGKTTLFNALAGMRQHVGNYPGVTVETKKGQMSYQAQVLDIVDLPGTYSLAPRSPDEMVAVDVILGEQANEPRPDVVVSIVDASNLERNLYLTTQAMELGVPVVIALNMTDIAKAHGITIDHEQLARRLGVPVVPIQANKKKGLEQLKEAIVAAARSPSVGSGVPFPEDFEREVAALQEALGEEVPHYFVRRLLLDVGGWTEQRLADSRGLGTRALLDAARSRLVQAGCRVPEVEARVRYRWIREATTDCVHRSAERLVSWTDRLDRLLTNRLWGTLVFLALMFLVFESIFTWARPVMKLLSDGKDVLADSLRDFLPTGPFASLITDGVLEGVGSVVVFLPQIVILFGFIAVLEDCGYMARAAFLMDKLMARCGLSGKSFIPMLSSVACAVPGIMATRVIENRRDRLATILVAPLMSCSARLPVYVLLIGAFLTDGFPFWVPGLVMFAMYSVGLVTAPFVALLLKRTLLRGEAPPFVMEMPLYKWPSVRSVVRRMTDSGWAFLRRAGTMILAAMVLVWALLYFPRAGSDGAEPYDVRIAAAQQDLDKLREKARAEQGPAQEQLQASIDSEAKKLNLLHGEWKRQSYLGRMGQAVEPVVRPLGWDWRIGMAAIASFPAREVVVGTLGIIYNQGKVDPDEIREAERISDTNLGRALQAATWDSDSRHRVFTVPVALSLMVFFALCCQCVSTLAIIRRETNSWRWPIFTFTYMTVLAYVAALLVYQIGRLI
ncbi:MAG TPA: ferrous iron transport protein B [Gemmataceae bacterium]|nr:ferrous iron transport protein B [Gemmataceae bacterium]